MRAGRGGRRSGLAARAPAQHDAHSRVQRKPGSGLGALRRALAPSASSSSRSCRPGRGGNAGPGGASVSAGACARPSSAPGRRTSWPGGPAEAGAGAMPGAAAEAGAIRVEAAEAVGAAEAEAGRRWRRRGRRGADRDGALHHRRVEPAVVGVRAVRHEGESIGVARRERHRVEDGRVRDGRVVDGPVVLPADRRARRDRDGPARERVFDDADLGVARLARDSCARERCPGSSRNEGEKPQERESERPAHLAPAIRRLAGTRFAWNVRRDP